mmetsp:Transcript_54126/g.116881  ORF Transcript_54126/g.116881 Transcript_54126/m.116881 type:complete len:255 (+) Transcript_54126:244-1008(+)
MQETEHWFISDRACTLFNQDLVTCSKVCKGQGAVAQSGHQGRPREAILLLIRLFVRQWMLWWRCSPWPAQPLCNVAAPSNAPIKLGSTLAVWTWKVVRIRDIAFCGQTLANGIRTLPGDVSMVAILAPASSSTLFVGVLYDARSSLAWECERLPVLRPTIAASVPPNPEPNHYGHNDCETQKAFDVKGTLVSMKKLLECGLREHMDCAERGQQLHGRHLETDILLVGHGGEAIFYFRDEPLALLHHLDLTGQPK